ncbi:MAG: heavy-metal-associated domain-containing protein [Synergistaceae bacterium]|jgi:copper chaperone|nr:heavy-metal-associated domain-containing protein [Synergistaceae bacterium]
MKKVFSVPDMSCEHCVKAISKALDGAGFSGYEVALDVKEVRVDTDAPEKVAAILDDEGYPATLK